MAPRKQRTAQVTRNPDLIRGIGKYSRSKMYHKRGLWAIKAKNGGAFPCHDKKPAADVPAVKPPKFYPADDVKKPLINKHKPRLTKLRSNITPGTVLIILAGRFKGKRVVFLKQLSSGLLLVTGPFKINGVPLRRVNQAYVIGTSTKVDISGVNTEKFDDKYFAKEVQKKKKKSEGEFFEANKEEKNVLPQDKKDDQKTVDTPLIAAIEGVKDLKTYLAARDHWELSVIMLDEGILYHLDPSRRRLPVGEWRTIVDNAIVIYNANVKNKSRKSITWKPLSGIPPQQGRGCGLWVMLYMNDIVKDKNLGFATKWEVRKGRKQQVYTATEIDAVRNEWANYVSSIQFVK